MQPVELQFKGSRTYLHGTDVYECAVDLLRGRFPDIGGRCRFTFHRMTKQPLSAVVEPFRAGAARPERCVADMHVTGEKTEASVWFVERDGAVAGRYPYDEEAVVQDCRIEGSRISLAQSPSARTIEIVVAMTKRLHNSLGMPEHGRWLFTRLDLDRFLTPQDRKDLSITLATPLRAAITRSVIRSGDQAIGSIFFSVGQS